MKEVTYLFGALEEPDVDALMRIGTRQQLHVGDKLLTEGTHPDAIYLVLDGDLSVSLKGRHHRARREGRDRRRDVAARIATCIGHTVRHHAGYGTAHPSRRAREEPRRRSGFSLRFYRALGCCSPAASARRRRPRRRSSAAFELVRWAGPDSPTWPACSAPLAGIPGATGLPC